MLVYLVYLSYSSHLRKRETKPFNCRLNHHVSESKHQSMFPSFSMIFHPFSTFFHIFPSFPPFSTFFRLFPPFSGWFLHSPTVLRTTVDPWNPRSPNVKGSGRPGPFARPRRLSQPSRRPGNSTRIHQPPQERCKVSRLLYIYIYYI